MSDSSAPLSRLGRWYAALAALASVAAVQASLFPRWPRAAPLPEDAVMQALKQQGLRPQAIKPTDAEQQPKRSREIALSAPLVFRFPSGEELRVARGSAHFRYSLQLASLTAPSPELSLSNRQLLNGPPPSAVGLIKGRSTQQTCFVPHALQADAFGVTAEQILQLVDSPTKGVAAVLRRTIGLQANYDYSCVVISVRSSPDSTMSASLWRSILSALSTALRDKHGRIGA
jgi:hypothetical protein